MQEPWNAAFEESLKNAATKLRQITAFINGQLGSRKQKVLFIPELPSLDLASLSDIFRPVILTALAEDPANGTSSLGLTDQAQEKLRALWNAPSVDSPDVFVIVEKPACARDFYHRLDVSDHSAVQSRLEEDPEEWDGGRVVYIGVILRKDWQIIAIEELLEPVIEPVLSLMLSVHWDGSEPLEAIVQMFMCNKGDPQVFCVCWSH